MNSTLLDHGKLTKRIAISEAKSAILPVPAKVPPPPPLADQMTSPLKKVNVDTDLPKLSRQTKQIIKRIQKRFSEDKLEENEEETKPEALGPQFDFLVRLLAALDGLVNLFRVTSRCPAFSEFKPILQQSLGQTIKISDIQKIVGLSPKFYTFERKENELLIDFPSAYISSSQILRKNELEAREATLLKLLQKLSSPSNKIKFTEKPSISIYPEQNSPARHEGSSESTKLSISNTRSNNQRVTFDSLPLAPLPPMPNEIVPETIPNILEKLDQTEERQHFKTSPALPKRSGILQRLKDEGLISSRPPSSSSNLTTHQKVEALRERMIAKIKEKEAQRKKSETYYQTLFNSVDYDDSKRLCELIKFYFTSRRVNNAFAVKIIEFASKNHGKVKSFEEENVILKHLLNVLPNWIRLVDNKQGDIVRIDPEVSMESVIETLDKIYEKKK